MKYQMHYPYCDRATEAVYYDKKLRKEGIREVVGWIEKNKKPFFLFDDLFYLPNWQKKLKEWGIDEGTSDKR